MSILRHLCLSGVLALAVLTAGAQAKISFKKIEHDFGEINEIDGMANTSFKFTNTGDSPLIISKVTASCGCTTPEWSAEPVAPGKTGEIKVGYNPKGRPGVFRKSISVIANAEPSTTVLNIAGKVNPRPKTLNEEYPREMGRLRFKSNFLSIGKVYNDSIKVGELEFINTSDSVVKASVYRSSGYVKGRFEPSTIPAGAKGKFIVEYDATKNNTFGTTNDRVYLLIDGQKESSYTISVSATIEENFSSLSDAEKANAPVASFDSQLFDFGSIKMGEVTSHVFKLTNKGKSDLLIRKVSASCGCTTSKNKNMAAPGETIDFTVTFNSRGKRGRQNRTLTVITNDPNNSNIALKLVGNVVAE